MRLLALGVIVAAVASSGLGAQSRPSLDAHLARFIVPGASTIGSRSRTRLAPAVKRETEEDWS